MELDGNMKYIAKTVNLIYICYTNNRKFSQLLDEVNSVYSSSCMYNDAHYLIRAQVAERFVECLEKN